jgi:hypothetical protein
VFAAGALLPAAADAAPGVYGGRAASIVTADFGVRA